jgi:UDP-N-acetylglucosamine 2-epimerase (non-hydrolysing)
MFDDRPPASASVNAAERVPTRLARPVCLAQTGIDAAENLRAEGVAEDRIRFVGNTMIDSLDRCLPMANCSTILESLRLGPREYCALTLHRPSNVDDDKSLERLADLLLCSGERLPVAYPVHPRTRRRLAASGLRSRLECGGRVLLTELLGYIDFLRLTSMARLVVTDSGGAQEETTVPVRLLTPNQRAGAWD